MILGSFTFEPLKHKKSGIHKLYFNYVSLSRFTYVSLSERRMQNQKKPDLGVFMPNIDQKETYLENRHKNQKAKQFDFEFCSFHYRIFYP